MRASTPGNGGSSGVRLSSLIKLGSKETVWMFSCRRPSPPHFSPLHPIAASSTGFVLRMVGAESTDEFGIIYFVNTSPADGMEGAEKTQNEGSNVFVLLQVGGKQWEPHLVDKSTSTIKSEVMLSQRGSIR